MALKIKGEKSYEVRKKSASRRRSLVKCHKCHHIARDHFKLRRHLVKYHLVNTPKKVTIYFNRNKVIKGKQYFGGTKTKEVSPVHRRNKRKTSKSSLSVPGRVSVFTDGNTNSAVHKTRLGVRDVSIHVKGLTGRIPKVLLRKSNKSVGGKISPLSQRPEKSTRRSEAISKNVLPKSKVSSPKSKNRRSPSLKIKRERSLQPQHCPLCDYIGRDNFNLRRHLQSKHEPKPPKQQLLYQCELCDYKNKYRFLVKRHSAVHSREGGHLRNDLSGYPCDRCNYVGGSACNLKRHKLSRHEKIKEAKLRCSLCDNWEPDRPALFGHFREAHGVIIESEKLEFEDYQSFMEFKTDMEKATFAKFVRQQTRAGQKKHVIFKCHRDGMFKSKSRGNQRKRALKTTGSNKINSACPASMRMTIDLNGKVSVVFTKTHVGHSNEVCRLTLTKEEKVLIAEMMESKLTFKEIISEIRNGMESERLERIHLLSRKDLQNIERWYKTKDSEETPKLSLDLNLDKWIGKVLKTNVVRLHKKSATILPKPFKCLDYDDFILILANDIQLAMLKEYGNECICIDNTYDYSVVKLTVLMVLDGSRQGFPCAFMLSSKIDKFIMKVFLDVVQKASGCPMKPSIFISGLPDYRRTEWSAVIDLPPSTEVLYSSWSVEEDLKKNLHKVKKEEDRQHVLDVIQQLIQEKNTPTHLQLLEKTIQFLDESPNTELFGKYFKTKLAGTAEKWAACFRNRLNADAKLGLESTHEILKFVYSEGHKNETLGDCINVLMSFCRDQMQDRVVLKERTCPLAVPNKHNSETLLDFITERHEIAKEMNSHPADSGVYEIMENNLHCQCLIRCFTCDTCIHAYRCTCSFSVVGWTICEHIHFCLMNNPEEATKASQQFDPSEEKRKLLLEFENMCEDIAADGNSGNECEAAHPKETYTQEQLPKDISKDSEGTSQSKPEVEEPVPGNSCEPNVLESMPVPKLEPVDIQTTEQLEQPNEPATHEPPKKMLEDAISKLQSRFLTICQNISSGVDLSLIEQAIASMENMFSSRQQT